MKSKSVIAFYALGLMHHTFTLYYTSFQIDFTKASRKEVLDLQTFSNRYLTSWNMGLQILYFVIALLCEILLLKQIAPKLTKKLSTIRGYFFLSLLLPISVVVSFFFWSIYMIDKDLIIPLGTDEILPFWIHHSIHTNILLLPVIEMALPKMRIPSITKAFLGLTVFSILYKITFFITYLETGKWVYNIYNELTWPQRILFSLTMYAVAIISLFAGFHIQHQKDTSSNIRQRQNYQTDVSIISKKLI